MACPNSDRCYAEKWVAYANDYIAAELTVQPGQKVVVSDGAAYGCIIIQDTAGSGLTMRGVRDAALGQPSNDEFFVSEAAAKQGVVIENRSRFSRW